MTPKEFQVIKEKVDTYKNKQARAEGALAKIKEQFKKEFNVDTIDEIKEKIKEEEKIVDKDKNKLETMYDKLEEKADWSSL